MVVITGKIKGKARPRVFNGHAITPKDTVNYENWVRINYQNQDGGFHEEAVKAVIIAYYEIPKSYTKKRRENILNGLEHPQKKPDADNVAKIILDSLNGIAYKDDSQVVELTVLKRFTTEKERVQFEINDI